MRRDYYGRMVKDEEVFKSTSSRSNVLELDRDMEEDELRRSVMKPDGSIDEVKFNKMIAAYNQREDWKKTGKVNDITSYMKTYHGDPEEDETVNYASMNLNELNSSVDKLQSEYKSMTGIGDRLKSLSRFEGWTPNDAETIKKELDIAREVQYQKTQPDAYGKLSEEDKRKLREMSESATNQKILGYNISDEYGAGFSNEQKYNMAKNLSAMDEALNMAKGKYNEKLKNEYDGMSDIDKLLSYDERLINEEEAKKREKEAAELANKHPILGSVASSAVNLLSPLDNIETISRNIKNKRTENYEPIDTNNMMFGQYRDDIRNKVTEKINNPIGDFLYNTGMSSADSLSAGLMGNGIGKYIIGGSAAANSSKDAANRGVSAEKSLATGLISGVLESLTESYSIGNLKSLALENPKGLKAIVKNIAKQSGTEASEEMVSEIGNTISDILLNDERSDYKQSIQNYIDAGMDEEDAVRQAKIDVAKNIGLSGLGGAISGGVLGGAASGIGKIQYESNIRNAGRSMDSNQKQSLVSYGQNMDEESRIRKLAESMSENSNARDYGRLYSETVDHVNSAIQNSNTQNELDANYQKLTEFADDNMRQYIDDLYREREISLNKTPKRNRSIFDRKSQDENQEIVKLDEDVNNMEDNQMDYREEVHDQESSEASKNAQYIRSLAEEAAANMEQRSNVENMKQLSEGVEYGNQEIPSNNRFGEDVQRTLNNQPAGRDLKTNKNIYENTTGTSHPAWNIANEIVRSDDNVQTDKKQHPAQQQERNIAVEPLENIPIYDNQQQQQLYEYGMRTLDQNAARSIASRYDSNTPIGLFTSAYTSFYNAGRRNNESFPKVLKNSGYASVVDNATLYEAYALGEQNAKSTINRDYGTVRQAEGKVSDEREIKSDNTFSEVDNAIAAKTGQDVFVKDALEHDANGAFSKSMARFYFSDNADNKLKSRGHELAEFANAWNKEGMKKVQDSVLNWYAHKEGYNALDSIINEYQDRYARVEGSKTYMDAAEELCNDAIGDLLSTEEGATDFLNWLKDDSGITAKEQKGVIQTIINFLDEIIGKIKSYVKEKGSNSDIDLEQAQKIRKIFFDALDTASENYRSSEKGVTNVENDTRYMINKDFEKEYDAWNKKDDSISFEIGTTSKALQSIGIGDKTIEIDSSKLIKIRDKHKGMTDSVIKQIPDIVENPVIIMQSLNQDSRITMFGTVNDANGKPVLAVIELNPTSRKGYELDLFKIASVYGKDNSQSLINRSDILYIDPNKNRTNKWLRVNRLQLPLHVTKYGSIKSISDVTAEVNSPENDIRYSLKDTGETRNLLKENEKLKSVVSSLKQEFELTKGLKPDMKTVEKVSKRILIDYSSTYSQEALASNLIKVFDYMHRSENVDFNEMMKITSEVAKPIVENSRCIDNSMKIQYKDMLDSFRKRPIKLNEEQKAEVEFQYGSYNEFRKRNFGRVLLSDNGISLDSLWGELSGQYPEFFHSDTNPNEQIFHILDAIDAVKPVYVNEYSSNLDEAAYDVSMRIYNDYFDIKAVQTFADKKQAQLNKARIEYRRKVAEVKHDNRLNYEKRLYNIKKEYTDRKVKMSRQQWERIAKVKAANYERRVTERNKRRSTEYRGKIKKNVTELTKWLSKPTDQKHVPESMKKVTLEFLSSIDLISNRADPKSIASLKVKNAFDNLSRQLRTIEKNEELDYYVEFDPDLQPAIDEFISNGKNKIYDLDVEQLRNLNDIVASVKRSITTANKLLSNRQYETIKELGQKSVDEISSKKEYKRSGVGLFHSIGKLLNMDMLDSYSYFSQLGDSSKTIYDSLREGFNQRVWKIKEAQDYMSNVLNGIDVKNWTGERANIHTIKVGSENFRLTTGQIMTLYCLNKRKQAKEHIYKGGIKLADFKSGSKTISQSHILYLNEINISKITSLLTDEQIEIANKMQKFLSENCSEWGNEVSMKQWGYKKFTEDNYFPINSYNNYLRSSDNTENQSSLYAIKNLGMTKSTVKGANNAIMVGDIFDVFTDHVTNMADYNAFTIPLSDAMKWYNFKTVKQEDNHLIAKSVKESIEKSYGPEAKEYFISLIKDINGVSNKDGSSGIANKFLSNYKAASVGANIRVAIQQPTAYVRAMAVMEPKYLAQAVFKKSAMQKVKVHSAIALWKSWGYYETLIGKSMKEVITGQTSRLEKLKDKSMSLAQLGDDVTWGVLWNACELEVKDKNNGIHTDSSEFYKLVSKRFDEVIDRTQVVDTALHRSKFMKSDGLAKLESAFMAEPTKSFNMLRNAWVDYKIHGKGKKNLIRATTAYVTTGILVSAAAAVMDAFRSRDEGEWVEKYIEGLKTNMVDNINPFNMIPYLKNISSWADGFDSSRMDIGGYNSLFKSFVQIGKMIQEPQKYKPYNVVRSMARGLSQVTGIPMYNTWRDLESLYNAVTGSNLGAPVSMSKYAGVKSALSSGDSEKAQEEINEVYHAKISDGKTSKEARAEIKRILTTEYKPQYEAGSSEEKRKISDMLKNIKVNGKSIYESEDFNRWNEKK